MHRNSLNNFIGHLSLRYDSTLPLYDTPHPYPYWPTPPLHDPPHPCMTQPPLPLHDPPTLPLHNPPHPCITHPMPTWPTIPYKTFPNSYTSPHIHLWIFKTLRVFISWVLVICKRLNVNWKKIHSIILSVICHSLGNFPPLIHIPCIHS